MKSKLILQARQDWRAFALMESNLKTTKPVRTQKFRKLSALESGSLCRDLHDTLLCTALLVSEEIIFLTFLSSIWQKLRTFTDILQIYAELCNFLRSETTIASCPTTILFPSSTLFW